MTENSYIYEVIELKNIKLYEELYAVTEEGKVWSYRSNKFLKQTLTNAGYPTVKLCKDGKSKTYMVHRLVAETFLENPDNLPVVNHINEDKTDCRVCNLEWCNYHYNNSYGVAVETRRKKASKKVYCVELDKEFNSQTEAAKEIGVSSSRISECCRGITKKAGGYHWQFS